MRAYCGRCGEKIKKSNQFCGICGASADQRQRSPKTATDPRPLLLNPTKLAIMAILTFGLYSIRWFYRQWRYIKLRDQSRAFPLGLALLDVLTAPFLFKRLGISKPIPKAIAIYVALIFLALIPSKWSLITLLAVVPLYMVQEEINQRYPDAVHAGFSKKMILLAILGACVWGVIIWYLFRN
jgi:hypothetical protein